MKLIKIDAQNPNPEIIKKIAISLELGELVVLPTETVYTFAVDATNKEAIDKVYLIKGRSFDKPLHVVVADKCMAKKYVEFSKKANLIAKKFLPGPLTLVLPQKLGILPKNLNSGSVSLGIRIPNLLLNQRISREFKKPYTTTSANISGGTNPYSIPEILDQLDEKQKAMIDLVVDVGNLPLLLPSTVLDLTKNQAKILREGPITSSELGRFL